jgi:redox-sensitive bicupin YhaK (pirin superfamily)
MLKKTELIKKLSKAMVDRKRQQQKKVEWEVSSNHSQLMYSLFIRTNVVANSFRTSRLCQKQLSHSPQKKVKLYIIVKYGGSAITEKSKFETLKNDVLAATAEQVKLTQSQCENVRFIIVHGAGKQCVYCISRLYSFREFWALSSPSV